MLERFGGIFRPRERKETLEAEQTLYVPNFDVLVISGFAGTGKTSAADDLNRLMVGTQFVKVGQNIRAEYTDLNNIPPQKDINIDLEQEKLMLKTRHSFPLILESRFGAVIGSDILIRFKEESPRIVKILTTADEKTRFERLIKRRQEENPEHTPEQIINDEIKRDREFVAKMQTLYPRILRDQHPFDPNIRNIDNLPVYDFVLDTTFIPKEKVKDAVIDILTENGYISALKRSDFGEGELGNRAFGLIKNCSPCEYDNCQRLAKQTLDSSGKRSVHSFPVCSDEHAAEKQQEIEEWALEKGYELKFGKNGNFEEKENQSGVIFKA